MGGAALARGPELAGWRPHPTGGSLAKHAEVGSSPAPLQGPLARVAPAAAWTGRGSCLKRGSGTDAARTRDHVRHRPGPKAPLLPACRGRKQLNPGPVAGLRLPEEKHAASGTTLATASPLIPPHVRTPPPGHSLPPASKRSRSIRQRERTESDMELEGGDEMGWIIWGRRGTAGMAVRGCPRMVGDWAANR